jgi:hypothetical protein
MKERRRLPAERLDQASRGAVRVELVQVVQDEEEVTCEPVVEGLREETGQPLRPAALVPGGTAAAPVRSELAEPKRVGEARREGGERGVRAVDRVPGRPEFSCPRSDQRCLAEAWRGDDRRQRAPECLVEPLVKSRSGEVIARKSRRGELGGEWPWRTPQKAPLARSRSRSRLGVERRGLPLLSWPS